MQDHSKRGFLSSFLPDLMPKNGLYKIMPKPKENRCPVSGLQLIQKKPNQKYSLRLKNKTTLHRLQFASHKNTGNVNEKQLPNGMTKIWLTTNRRLTKQWLFINQQTYVLKNAQNENKNTASFSGWKILSFKLPLKLRNTTSYFLGLKLARKPRDTIVWKLEHCFRPGVCPSKKPRKSYWRYLPNCTPTNGLLYS